MKNLVTSILFMTISFIAICQNNDNIKALITGYKENDTIKLDDFLKIKEISLNKNNYTVISFVLVYTDNKYDFMMKGNSNNLNDEMKKRLLNFKNMNRKFLKITLKAITVQTPQNEQIKISPLKYILKIK
jgi:hypothetical protein